MDLTTPITKMPSDEESLRLARMNLSLGHPVSVTSSHGFCGIVTPWETYSYYYHKVHGVYPEFVGYEQMTDEKMQKTMYGNQKQ